MKPCPRCEANRRVDLVSHNDHVTINGQEISFAAQSYRCRECGEEFDSMETLDKNLESARDTYDRLFKTPTCDEIVALRAEYNASQKAFGLLLGFGELTMNSYEQGAMPDNTHRLLLRLAKSTHIFREIYAENKHKIGAIQRKCIESSEGFNREQHQ
jgi:putative zinc finger/helix-turn-helix YgiT family protein